MKRFIVSVLCVSVFFIGLGGLIESVGAKFKSDEKALELLRLARQAVGGDANLRAVNSMSIVGKATKTFNVGGESRSEQGDWELNLELPNKFSKAFKIQINGDGMREKTESADKEVFIVQKSDKVMVRKGEGELPKEGGVFVIKKDEGDDKVLERSEMPNDDAKKVVVKDIVEDDLRVSIDKMHQNDLVRTTLSLLLTAPQEANVEYIFAGEGSVDGSACNIVEARTGGSSIKLFLDKSSNLPRMMSFQDAKPMMFFRIKKDDETEVPGEVKTFERRLEKPEMAEFQIKFSDYRSVNGIQLPFKWTQTVGGQTDETIDITTYEINPANIAEKFKELPQKIMMRKKQ